MEDIDRVSVDVDLVIHLLSTLHPALSVDEREPCLPRVWMVSMVLPVDALGFHSFTSESTGNVDVSTSISSTPKSVFLIFKLQASHRLFCLHSPTLHCPMDIT